MSSYLKAKVLRGPTLDFRVTCHTLMKKHIFWYPLHFATFVILFPNLCLKIKWTKTFKNVFSVLFLSWYTHHCIAGNPIALLYGRALRKTVFAEIFIFASFGNRRFSKIRVGASYSSFFRTRPDSRKLVLTLIFAKKLRKNCKKRVGTSRNSNFGNISVMSEPSELVSTRENSSRLENRLENLVKSLECRALLAP